MTPPQNPYSSDAELDAPPALRTDLQALFAAPPVPARVDARVRRDSAAQFARIAHAQQRHRRLLRWVGAGAAAAAAAVLVAVMVLPRDDRPDESVLAQGSGAGTPDAPSVAPTTPPPVYVAGKGDVDRSGRVDILDAFAIARALRSQAGPPDAWDVTGDGTVDQGDVEQVAHDAVRVTPTKVADAGPRRASSRDDALMGDARAEGGGLIR